MLKKLIISNAGRRIYKYMNDPFLMSVAANYFSSFSYPVVENFFKQVFNLKPEIEEELKNAKTITDFEKIFNDAVGVIDVQVNNGSISVDQSFLNAIKGIRFDHQNGTVSVSNSSLKAPVLQMGGTGHGQTTITGSKLSAGGSQVHVGGGASIKISGNASMKLS